MPGLETIAENIRQQAADADMPEIVAVYQRLSPSSKVIFYPRRKKWPWWPLISADGAPNPTVR